MNNRPVTRGYAMQQGIVIGQQENIGHRQNQALIDHGYALQEDSNELDFPLLGDPMLTFGQNPISPPANFHNDSTRRSDQRLNFREMSELLDDAEINEYENFLNLTDQQHEELLDFEENDAMDNEQQLSELNFGLILHNWERKMGMDRRVRCSTPINTEQVQVDIPMTVEQSPKMRQQIRDASQNVPRAIGSPSQPVQAVNRTPNTLIERHQHFVNEQLGSSRIVPNRQMIGSNLNRNIGHYQSQNQYMGRPQQNKNRGLSDNPNTMQVCPTQNRYAIAPHQTPADWSFLSSSLWEKVPELKGSDGPEAVKDFFKKFDFATMSWPMEMKIGGLKCKLSGRAERALNIALESSRVHDYNAIKNKILGQLDCTDSQELLAMNELRRGIIRKAGESIDELGDRLLLLVKRSHPGISHEALDHIAINHLIISIGNEALSLHLESTRAKGMNFDQFVSFATRVEATQIAVRNTNKPGNNQPNDRDGSSSNNHNNSRGIFCDNCGRRGHFSNQCWNRNGDYANANRNYSQNFQPNQQSFNQQNRSEYVANNQNSNLQPYATGADRTNKNVNFQQQQLRNGPVNRLKGNLLTINENENGDGAYIGHLQTEINEFFEAEKDDAVTKKGEVGQMIVVNVSTCGVEANGIIDTGAQLSLVSAPFFYKIAKSLNKQLKDFEFSSKGWEIFDVNGGTVGCFGSVLLPIERKALKVNIRLHITAAPLKYEFLFGTNALSDLGFKLYDSIGEKMINFENMETNPESARIVFNTIIPPMTSNFVKKGKKNLAENALISLKNNSAMPIVESAAVIANERTAMSKIDCPCSPIVLNVDEIGKAERDYLLATGLSSEKGTIGNCQKKSVNRSKESEKECQKSVSNQTGRKKKKSGTKKNFHQLEAADILEEGDASVDCHRKNWKKEVEFDNEMTSWIKKRFENVPMQEQRKKKVVGENNGCEMNSSPNPNYREPWNRDHYRQSPSYRKPRNGDRRLFGGNNQRWERFSSHYPYVNSQSLNRKPRSTIVTNSKAYLATHDLSGNSEFD